MMEVHIASKLLYVGGNGTDIAGDANSFRADLRE